MIPCQIQPPSFIAMNKQSKPVSKTKSKSEKSKPRSQSVGPSGQNTKHAFDDEGPALEQERTRRWLWPLICAIAVAVTSTIYLLRVDRVVGLMIDDAWYILLAQAMATGQGYTVINSPSQGILPLYPPGFPALLSLFCRIAPQFPQNIYLLKSVSIAAMFGLGAIAYVYFKRERAMPNHIAFGIALAATLSPPLVTLATSTVMSECVFGLSFLATVLVIERSARQQKPILKLTYAVMGAALASFTFLTRSMAVGLLAAGVIYLIKKRMFVMAWIYSASVAAFSLPWMIYSSLRAPTVAQQNEQGGHIIRGYSSQFWDKIAGYPEVGEISLADLPVRVWNNILEITGLNVGAILVNPLFPGLSQASGERWGGIGTMVSTPLAAIVIIGFVTTAREKMTFSEIALPLSLLAPLSWGFAQFRYVAPYTPFVIFYLLMGAAALSRWRQQWSRAKQVTSSTRLLGATLCATILCSLYSHADYITSKFSSDAQLRPRWIRMFEENENLLKWANENLPRDGVLLTHNSPMAYLYTGRKTVNYDFPAERWDLWKQLGIRYFVRNAPWALSNRDEISQNFRTVYRTDESLGLHVVDLGEPASRRPWTRPAR